MIGYWLQLFRPRANNDIKAFLPENVQFITCAESDAIRQAYEGKARVLLECPEAIDGVALGKSIFADSFKARSVVSSDFFGSELPSGRILAQHNFALREVATPVKAHLMAARVAGYREACFGLDDAQKQPILFEHPQCANILISTTPLAGFITSRFAPCCDWKILMGRLLAWLAGNDGIVQIDYQQTVRPTYLAKEALPQTAEEDAFSRNAEWFYREMVYNAHGTTGVFEGYSSLVDVTGKQCIMPALRGDCLGECSAVGALDYALHKEVTGKDMAEGLLKTLFETSKVRDVCKASQTYGALFFDTESVSVYGDDNSRAALGAVLSEELLDNPAHARQLLEIGYSLLRTTGPNGLRIPSLIQPESFQGHYEYTEYLRARTWKTYFENNYPKCHPHYQAWHWAFNLELYALSGDRRFLDSAKAAIDEANRLFPDFYWQNGATGDWARVLLPYAMLVEVDDTPEHREWLDKVASFYIDKMNEFGIVPEVMGKRELGHYPAPASNADYGVAECTLIQFNGDPACDLLYSLNYAFPGMHEAYMATGNERYKAACDKMADFFCRVQAHSTAQPYLDGAWLHGFDFQLWEFFSSASDSGWGPWCVETGWTNSWIATTMALRQLNRPLLSVKAADVYRELAPKVAEEMFRPLMPSVTTRGTRTEINTTNFSSFTQG